MLEVFSTQQLIDCAKPPFGYSLGCQGGDIGSTFEHLKIAPIILEADYPYVAKDQACMAEHAKSHNIHVVDRFAVKPKNVTQLKAAVAQQPVAVALSGYNDFFIQYKQGIFDSGLCGTTLDHAVVLVGFGVDAATEDEYWIVRNNWGTTWGEHGYMRLKMQDGEGICGVNMAPTYASVSN